MESIGEALKTRRTEKGLSLADVFEATKITMQNLAALEENRFDAFANRVYARAFLRDYANYLGLDSAELLQRYESDWIASTPMPVVKKRRSPIAAIIVVLLLLGLAATGAYYYYPEYVGSLIPAVKKPADSPVVQKPVPVVDVKPEPAPITKPINDVTMTPGAENNGATATDQPDKPVTDVPDKPVQPVDKPAPAVPPGKVKVELVVLNNPVWVHVKLDGKTMFEPRTLQPGERITIAPSKTIWIRAGNGGGLDVIVNGKNTGRFGQPGQPLTRTFKPVP